MYIALYSYIVYSSKLLDSYDIVNIKNTIELIHNFFGTHHKATGTWPRSMEPNICLAS